MKVRCLLIGVVVMFVAGVLTTSSYPNAVGLWTFDNVQGNIVKDDSRNGNDGKIVGAPKVAAGHKGNALDFNGVSDGVEIKTSDSLAKTVSQITLEAWIFPRADAQMSIITKWDGNVNGVIHFELQAGRAMRFCMRSGNEVADVVNIDLKTGGNAIPQNTWTHVAETYDGKTARIYLNGVEAVNGACSGNMRDNADMKYWIGTLYTTQDRWFNGLIDEVRIWSRALTPDEVKKSFDGTLAILAVTPVGKLTTTWANIKAR